MKAKRGFSLIEMMVAVAVLLVIAGAIFSALTRYQKTYVATQMKSDMYYGIRGASELIAQEVGQAGLLSLPATQLVGSVGATGSSTVALNSVTYIFVGEQLLIDTGSNEELVSVTARNTSLNTITGVFNKTHLTGAAVNALGVFPQGVLSSSTGTALKMFGDMNADGTLFYVQYDCDTTAGTLKRSTTPITASSRNPSHLLLTNLIANPGGAPCFSYISTTAAGYTFVTSVGVTLSIRTDQRDPQTGVFLTMTKSFLNLTPRDVLAGLEFANAGITTRLQPTPPGVPLP